MVHLPDVGSIRPGDILLTFNAESDDLRGAKASQAIRSVTRGLFSHAMICSSPPTFVEAIGPGVSTLSLANCFAHDIANVRILRYPDAKVAAGAAALAQLEIGRNYSYARAVRSVFPIPMLDRVDDHGVFCSALVAQVYTAAGSKVFARTPADRTTPATIDRLPELEDITATIFRSALAPNNIATLSALDGNRVATLSARQTELSRKCAAALFPAAERIARYNPAASLQPTPTFYGLLNFVIDAIGATLAIPEADQVHYVDAVSALDAALAEFIALGELAALTKEIAEADGNTLAATLRESDKAVPDIDETAMRNLLTAGRVEVAKRLEAIAHWEARGSSSRAMTAYLEIDRTTARFIGERNELLELILARLERLRR